MTDAGRVITIGFGVGQVSIESWLAEHPTIVDAIAAAGARVVLLEIDDLEPVGDWNEHVSTTLASAAARLDSAIEYPLFVAGVGLRSLIDAGVVERGGHWQPATPPRAPRGAFVGYFAVGEGGAIYVAPDGQRVPPELIVLAALQGR